MVFEIAENKNNVKLTKINIENVFERNLCAFVFTSRSHWNRGISKRGFSYFKTGFLFLLLHLITYF